jgi:hypothetical protein
MGSSAVWQKSSSFILQFNQAVGSYYATGSAQGLGTTYTCAFDSTNPTNLNCTGAPMPYDTQVYIQLFDAITKTNVYSNMITFARNRAMPAGMVCDSEPQWGGDIPAHQLGWGCFAITCYQNGVVFYGNNELCLGEWPFEWDFPHPLYNTLLNQD